MHVSPIGDEDIPFCNGRAVEPLSTRLIGQFDVATAFAWNIEGAMKPPWAIVFPMPIRLRPTPTTFRVLPLT